MSGILLSNNKIETSFRERKEERTRFLDKFTDRDYNWNTKETTQSLFYRTDNFPKSDVTFHQNYLMYLERCWGDHLGAVFTPDILWNSLLCELATIVKADPEAYRPLFTNSPEKTEIVVLSGDPVLLPLSSIIDALKELVPTDTSSFLPEFSTSTLRSTHAFNANFADMCSPYYNYSMLACDIPVLDIRGTADDYQKIVDNWSKLKPLFAPQGKYMDQVDTLLRQVSSSLNDTSFWTKMFSLEHCGSGSDVEVSGWWTQIYREQPRLAYPSNFATHVAKVPYKNLDDGKNYEMYDGLFYSKMSGDFLEPNFGFAVYEKTEVVTTVVREDPRLVVYPQ